MAADNRKGEKAAVASTMATLGAIVGGPLGLVVGGLLGYALSNKFMK